MHVADQRIHRAGFLPAGALGGLDRLHESVEDDRAHQRLAVGETAVERTDSDSGPARDVLERGRRPVFDEEVTGRSEDLLVVAPSVGTQRTGFSATIRHLLGRRLLGSTLDIELNGG